MKAVLIIFLCFVLINCKKESEPVIDTSNDKISITSVIPANGLQDGKLTDFTIKGDYALSSHVSGTISIGFNNQYSPGSYTMFTDKDTIITQGNGQFQFNVKTLVKDWGTKGVFSILVNISPNPIPHVTWNTYASDYYFFTKLP